MNPKEESLLNLLNDLRGRLDEAESLVRSGFATATLEPIAIKGEHVKDITPDAYKKWRATGSTEANVVRRYEPFDGFFQFANDSEDATCEISSFELHDPENPDEPAKYGLLATPDSGKYDWFTYELVVDGSVTQDFAWTEWVVKVATDVPTDIFCQFVLDTEEDPFWIDVTSAHATQLGTFIHVRLNRDAVIERSDGTPIQKVRLILSMGDQAGPIRLHNFTIYGSAA